MDDEPKLDVGKLAMWRLQTRDNFGGMWLSDYHLPNRLGMDYVEPVGQEEMQGGGMEMRM